MGLVDTPGKGRKPGRPAKGFRKDDLLAVRLEDDLSVQIEDYLNFLGSDPAYQGLSVTRADAVRRLLMIGLDEEKKRMSKK